MSLRRGGWQRAAFAHIGHRLIVLRTYVGLQCMIEVTEQVDLQLKTAVTNLLRRLYGTNFKIVGLNVGMGQLNEAHVGPFGVRKIVRDRDLLFCCCSCMIPSPRPSRCI